MEILNRKLDGEKYIERKMLHEEKHVIVVEEEVEGDALPTPVKKQKKERDPRPEPLSLSEQLRIILAPLESDDAWPKDQPAPCAHWGNQVSWHPAFKREILLGG